MTDDEGDNALVARMVARQRAERATRLAQAKREAAARGKQPFDLDELEALYPTSTPGGFRLPREERAREYEYRYYVHRPETMSLAEWAAEEWAMDTGAAPPPPGDRAQREARAVRAMVERQLTGGGVWSDRGDYDEVAGLRRAMREAHGQGEVFGEALVELLEHPDVRARTGAVAALGDLAGHVSADAVVDVLTRRPRLFRGVTPAPGLPVDGADLEACLATVVARLLRSGDVRATAFLRDHLARTGSLPALMALAGAAPDWVAAHAAAVVPRSAIGGVLHRLPERAQRRAVVEALAPWPADEGREVVARSFWSTLPVSDDEREELQRIIRPIP